jgi:hypothetical protein
MGRTIFERFRASRNLLIACFHSGVYDFGLVFLPQESEFLSKEYFIEEIELCMDFPKCHLGLFCWNSQLVLHSILCIGLQTHRHCVLFAFMFVCAIHGLFENLKSAIRLFYDPHKF